MRVSYATEMNECGWTAENPTNGHVVAALIENQAKEETLMKQEMLCARWEGGGAVQSRQHVVSGDSP